MTVYELNPDQLTELKQSYYAQLVDRDLSYDELANIDFYVTDYDVRKAFAGTVFTNDDFFCSAGQEPEDTTLEDRLLALEAKVRFIMDQGYIPFVSPFPSSTEKQLADYVRKAANALNMAANCAHLLRY